MKTFADYKTDAEHWITLLTSEYYPDVLIDAVALYKPVLVYFGQILKTVATSDELLESISSLKEVWLRIQLARIFRKYVCPELPVEMLKKKSQTADIIAKFGKNFRPIQIVQECFEKRPLDDETLCALLWEYKDRGKKGYDLTEKLFKIIETLFPTIQVNGPARAGKDILLGDIFSNYPNPKRPVDFVLYENNEIVAIGLARYDSDRGGAQEDDRTGGYANCADEILQYAQGNKLKLKLVFVNDGPGLLLGSMWNDYANLEIRTPWQGKILVTTLRMLPERLTQNWLNS